MRLADKIAIIVGAGQSPGEGMGNGRATALRFARAGAKILAVDRSLASATETAQLVAGPGGEAVPLAADRTQEHTRPQPTRAARRDRGGAAIPHDQRRGRTAAGAASPPR